MALRTQLEPSQSPLKSPAARAFFLHFAVFGSIFLWAFIQSHLHHQSWGSNEPQGAIQATLVSRAPALPLPEDHPPSPNVLATETPSPAPAPEAPATKAAAPESDAIPIPIKQTPKPKPAVVKQAPQPPPPKPIAKEQPKQQTRAALHPQPIIKQDNRAQYGQAAPQMARAMTEQRGTESRVTTPGGDFGTRFGWYVDQIKRKVQPNLHPQEIDPGTPAGAKATVIFDVSRAGVPSGVRIDISSRSSSLDTACIRAVQRVDTFGPLPAGYSQSSLRVSYYCDNDPSGN
ncbi:MAG TPA: TonB family protein [Acidisarcina sp.]